MASSIMSAMVQQRCSNADGEGSIQKEAYNEDCASDNPTLSTYSSRHRRRGRSSSKKRRHVYFGSVEVLVPNGIILVPQLFVRSSKEERSTWLPIRQPTILVTDNTIFNFVTFELEIYEAMHQRQLCQISTGHHGMRSKKHRGSFSIRSSSSWPSLHLHHRRSQTTRTKQQDQQKVSERRGLEFSPPPPPPPSPPPLCKSISRKSSRKRHQVSSLELIEDSLEVLDARINQLSRTYPLLKQGSKEESGIPATTTGRTMVLPSPSSRASEPFRSKSAKCA